MRSRAAAAAASRRPSGCSARSGARRSTPCTRSAASSTTSPTTRRRRATPRRCSAAGASELDRVYAGDADASRSASRSPTPCGASRCRSRHFADLIRGVEMDLSRRRYATFDELYEYCYLVASTVGLLCIEIFGHRTPSARDYARDLGVAFQLTNILRDVREDAARGRLYLPLEDLAPLRLRRGRAARRRYSPRVGALMAFECGRARAYYLRARGSLAPEDRRALAPAEAMRLIYERLLARIESRRFDVFHERIALPRYEQRRPRARRLGAGAAPGAERMARRRGDRRRLRRAVRGGGARGARGARHGPRGAPAPRRARLVVPRRRRRGTVVDNGQHAMMGCYRRTLAFLERIGAGGQGAAPGEPARRSRRIRGCGAGAIACPALAEPAPPRRAACCATACCRARERLARAARRAWR